MGIGIQPVLQPKLLHDIRRKTLIRRTASQTKGEENVFFYGQRWNQIKILIHKTYFAAAKYSQLFFLQTGQIYTIYDYFSLIKGIQPTDHVQQSGFAGAGCTDNGGKLTFLNRKIDAIQGFDLCLSLSKVFL